MVGSPSFPVGPFNTTHGSLDPLMDDLRRFHDFFWTAYDDRKWETGYRDDLPLVKRAARMSVVECDEIIVILSWPFHMIDREGHTYPRDQYPDLAEMADVYEIAKSLNLGEVIEYRPFPLQHDRIGSNREGAAEGRDERNLKATALVKEAAEKWARELAEEHIARTHPDFEEAKRRMTDAYGKLFELEHGLRRFVSQTLQDRYVDEWWTNATVNQDIRDDVEDKKREKRGAYLDELDTSILAYADFPDLRAIIMDNQGVFRHVLGPREQPINWFTSVLAALEPIRNRIGHMNTLSSDDLQDFYRDSDRILAAIRSKAQSQ